MFLRRFSVAHVIIFRYSLLKTTLWTSSKVFLTQHKNPALPEPFAELKNPFWNFFKKPTVQSSTSQHLKTKWFMTRPSFYPPCALHWRRRRSRHQKCWLKRLCFHLRNNAAQRGARGSLLNPHTVFLYTKMSSKLNKQTNKCDRRMVRSFLLAWRRTSDAWQAAMQHGFTKAFHKVRAKLKGQRKYFTAVAVHFLNTRVKMRLQLLQMVKMTVGLSFWNSLLQF